MSGGLVPGDRLSLRSVQQELADVTVKRATSGEDVTAGLIATGGGKTLGWVATYVAGCRADAWDRVLVYSPRTALATQGEVDARDWLSRYAQPRPRPVVHRTNAESRVPRGASGSISTYQSLVTNPDVHLRWAERNAGRFLLVGDEFHFLGAEGDDATRAAEAFAELSKHAAHTLVLTGTPYRSDDQRLVLCDDLYETSGGRVRFAPHVEFLYQDGVEAGTLRTIQADLVDGSTTWTETDQRGTQTRYRLPVSAIDDGHLGRALRDRRVWEPIVDKALARLDEVRETVHPEFGGMLVGVDQRHARELLAYAERVAPHYRYALAVSSEGASAQRALWEVRHREADVLVAVAMPTLGFDAKHLTVVGYLGRIRHHGWVEQLVGRALRYWPEVPYEQQACYLVGPADVRLRRFVDTMRSHADTGELRRQQAAQQPGAAPTPGSARLISLDDATLRGRLVYGADAAGLGDLTDAQASAVRAWLADTGQVGVSEAAAARLLRAAGLDLDEFLAAHLASREAEAEVEDVDVPEWLRGLSVAEGRKVANRRVAGMVSGWARKHGKDPQAEVRAAHARLNRAQGVRSSSDLVDPVRFAERVRLAVGWLAERGG